MGDKIIHAHKAFLEKRSPYFNRMFGSDWKEATAGLVQFFKCNIKTLLLVARDGFFKLFSIFEQYD